MGRRDAAKAEDSSARPLLNSAVHFAGLDSGSLHGHMLKWGRSDVNVSGHQATGRETP